MKEPMKLIKITNRCHVLTSRGMCTTPILYPFYEKVSYILPMFGKGAQIVEVLDNGVEVPLTIYNFDKNNTIREVETHNLKQSQGNTEQTEVSEDTVVSTVLGKGQDVIMERSVSNNNNNQNKNQNNFKQNKFNNKNKNQQNNQNQQQKNHVKLDAVKEQKITTETIVEEV